MSLTDYEFLLSQISDLISPNERISGNRSILVDERLVLTLRYLAIRESFQFLSYKFRISLVAVSFILKECCSAISDGLQNIFIELPNSREKWLEIYRKFEQRWNYPHALRAIYGKYVRVVKPNNGSSYFYNYKHTDSIIPLVIAGPQYECLCADVGSNGRVNDSEIWNKRSLLQAIDDGSVKLPEDDYLTNDCKLPHIFLGDDASALKQL